MLFQNNLLNNRYFIYLMKYKYKRLILMQSKKIIHVVSCHAEGEVGDVIVSL